MNSGPLVSILINNYNYGHFLSDAIDSALNQTYKNIEVIVVDDGSTDDSREIIARYGDRIIPILKKNGGQASAFNAGFGRSTGEIVCLLDADDMFLQAKVERLVHVFEMHRECSWCFDRLVCVDATGCPKGEGVVSALAAECDFRAEITRGKLHFSAPATSGLSFKRSLLAKILPMPEAEGISLSDDYMKVASLGLGKGVYLSEGYTLQRIHGANLYTDRAESERLKLKSSIQLLTSCTLASSFPQLHKFTDKLFARALALCLLAGNMTQQQRKISRAYLAAANSGRRLGIVSRTACHVLLYRAKLSV